MGLLKTQKLDNGNIGFECIYGGIEAPFGGIDSSKAPRYIDPKCFADASNFLIVDNELCICNLFPANFPSNGLTYPYNIGGLHGGTTDPATLLGVGTLPCENVVKNWALYASSKVDSSNYWHYRLILWTNDSSTVESYDFPLYGQQITSPGQNAKALVTLSFTYPTGIQTMPAAVPGITYDGLWYEMYAYNPTITGVPTGGLTACQYIPQLNYILQSSTTIFGNTPSGPSMPTTPPTLTQLRDDLYNFFTYHSGTPNLTPFTTGAKIGSNSFELVAFTQPSGPGGCSSFPSVDGAAGNAIGLAGGTYSYMYGYYPATFSNPFVQSYVGGPGGPPPSPFIQPSVQISITPFSGGVDPGTLIYSNIPIQQLTWETIGNNLYLAGWPAGYMLQYNDKTKQFIYLTQYQGARVLKKMAGHLISIGAIESAQQPEIDNNQLWFSWSGTPNVSMWQAVDPSTNLQTGAGGEQLADISDQLIGLVVSNSVVFILRAEGLSYGSVTQSAKLPFDINHVALCKFGQGCSSTSLWTQFDQLGFYVGSTNIFILQQGPQAVGDKICEELYPDLIYRSRGSTNTPDQPFFDLLYETVNVEPLTMVINNRPITLFTVNINGTLYCYSPLDDTWMKLTTQSEYFVPTYTFNNQILKCVSLPADGTTGECGSYQYKGAYLYIQQAITYSSLNVELQAPELFQFLPQISPNQDSFVIFPAEEISHGRDITIDAIYATLSGIPGVVVTMTVSGWQGNPSTYLTDVLYSQVTLDASAVPSQSEEYQFFNADGSAITLKAPQLKLLISGQTPPTFTPAPGHQYPFDSNPYFKASKISMFGSFDPNQRPV